MSLKRERCDECGTMHTRCPECDGTHITPFEIKAVDYPATTGVFQFVKKAERGESATFEHVCWDCGWSEEWTITVE